MHTEEIYEGSMMGLKQHREKCPDCGDKFDHGPDPECNCNQPLMIYIPRGEHIHISCPVHGDRKIYGGPIVTC